MAINGRETVRACSRALVLLTLLVMAGAPSAQDGVRVATMTPDRKAVFREVTVSGSVTPARRAQLSVQIPGLVRALLVDEGSVVAQGDLLLELDDELARHALQSAAAQITQAKAALEDAERRLGEAEYLGPKGSIAKTQVDNLRAEVMGDRAALARVTADHARQKAVVERHRLTAPFAGIISRRATDIGEWVALGDPVLELVSMSGLRIDLDLAEAYLAGLGEDSRITFRLNAVPERDFEARLLRIVPVTDTTSRTFRVQIVPLDPSAPLSPGLSATATLQLPTGRVGLLVPRDALLRSADGRVTVWTTGTGSSPTATERAVSVGETFSGKVEILDGLPEGEAVVIRGNEGLRPGQALQLVTGAER